MFLIFAAAGFAAETDQFQLLIARGLALDHFGDYTGAIRTFREALALIDKQQLGDWARATTLNSLAMSYDEIGQPAEAIHIYRRALKLIEKERGKDSLDYATVLGNLGADYSHVGQARLAEQMLRETIRIFKSKTPVDEVRLAISQSILAPVILASGQIREGEEMLVNCIAIFEKLPEQRRQLPAALNNLGVLRRDQKQFPEAIKLFQQAIAVLEDEYGPDHTKLIRALNNLALALYESGKAAEAGPHLARALAIADRAKATEQQSYGALLLNYAEYLRKMGRKDESKQYERRGKDIITDAQRRNGIGQTIDVASFRSR